MLSEWKQYTCCFLVPFAVPSIGKYQWTTSIYIYIRCSTCSNRAKLWGQHTASQRGTVHIVHGRGCSRLLNDVCYWRRICNESCQRLLQFHEAGPLSANRCAAHMVDLKTSLVNFCKPCVCPCSSFCIRTHISSTGQKIKSSVCYECKTQMNCKSTGTHVCCVFVCHMAMGKNVWRETPKNISQKAFGLFSASCSLQAYNIECSYIISAKCMEEPSHCPAKLILSFLLKQKTSNI